MREEVTHTVLRLLIGGSPCTFWSIAKSKNRETTPEGLGWELFKNYLLAKEKFSPDIFLYENNVSAAKPVKEQIQEELIGSGDGRYIEINSALVSAQSRKRFYVHNCGRVEQPSDRWITLQSVLESGVSCREKSLCLVSTHYKKNENDYFPRRRGTVVFEPVFNVGDCATVQKRIPEIVEKIGYLPEMFNAYNRAEITDKSPTLSTGSMVTSSCATLKFERTDKPVYEVKDGVISAPSERLEPSRITLRAHIAEPPRIIRLTRAILFIRVSARKMSRGIVARPARTSTRIAETETLSVSRHGLISSTRLRPRARR